MLAKKITFVTGTRADFGKVRPLAERCVEAGYKVTFFVTGMHMLEKYGLTKREVQKLKGVNTFEVINQRAEDSQDQIIQKTVSIFSDYISENRPDLVVIHGDRAEAFACATVCATNYILSAHIEGGEVSGTIDEVYRHCITKLCNYHFVSNSTAERRIIQLGEDRHTVHVIGSPELDLHLNGPLIPISEVKKYYEIPFENYGIVIFHPVTSEIDSLGKQAHILFNDLARTNKNFVVIASNNDPGTSLITNVVMNLSDKNFRILPSMRFQYFSSLLKNAALLVGNSSTGAREAPFLGIPSIEVGTRQKGRSQAISITKIPSPEQNDIYNAVLRNWGRRFPPNIEFGNGSAAERFTFLLEQRGFFDLQLQKQFQDIVDE